MLLNISGFLGPVVDWWVQTFYPSAYYHGVFEPMPIAIFRLFAGFVVAVMAILVFVQLAAGIAYWIVRAPLMAAEALYFSIWPRPVPLAGGYVSGAGAGMAAIGDVSRPTNRYSASVDCPACAQRVRIVVDALAMGSDCGTSNNDGDTVHANRWDQVAGDKATSGVNADARNSRHGCLP